METLYTKKTFYELDVYPLIYIYYQMITLLYKNKDKENWFCKLNSNGESMLLSSSES